jgi:phage terminase large subunit-like protein
VTLLEPASADLLSRMTQLPKVQQEEVMRRYRAKTSKERQIWYCQRGRSCDGDPHEGAPYQHARADQWPPPGVDWDVWFFMAGRGAGKTKAGGNWVRQMSKVAPRIALIGRRGKDVRQTMVEGPAGLIRACELAGESYDWKPALMQFTFENGALALGYSAEEPESLRGPEHAAGWLDEPCHMALIEEVWSNYGLGLRAMGVPGGAKTLLTSSPLPIKWTKDRIAEKGQVLTDDLGEPLVDEEGEIQRAPRTVLVSVPTSINLKNLDPGYKRRVINPLRGTRKGKQELDAALLEDVEGALWEAAWHKRKKYKREQYDRVVIAVDPAGTNKKTSDLTGIVVCARVGVGEEARYVVLADYSGHYTPAGWATKTVELYNKFQADAVVIERYGGDSAETILRKTKDPETGKNFRGKISPVNAVAGKKLRAEPIAALYEQGMVDHLEGANLAELEDEQLTWVPDATKESPNRIDACVHGIADLSGRRVARGSAAKPPSRRLSGSAPNHAPGSAYARRNALKGLRK